MFPPSVSLSLFLASSVFHSINIFVVWPRASIANHVAFLHLTISIIVAERPDIDFQQMQLADRIAMKTLSYDAQTIRQLHKSSTTLQVFIRK